MFLLTSCKLCTQLRLNAKASLVPMLEETIIPFEYIKDLIVVQAQVNDASSPYSFIFDTGAFESKLEYELAEALQLKTRSSRSNGTAQGISRKIEVTLLDALWLQGAQFLGIAAGKVKYDPQSYSPCIAPDGIIGANLIRLAHWKIDFQRHELVVSDRPIAVDPNVKKYTLAFKTPFLSGTPEITITIEGELIRGVIFDLGYNGGLVLPQAYAEQFSAPTSQTIIDQSTAGIFGRNQDTLRVKELQVELADCNTQLPVQFSALNKALLGNDFLEHFIVYLDYHKQQIVLQPYEEVEIEETQTFIPGILNDSMWIVNRTIPAYPLVIGDTLKTINDLEPWQVFSAHCDYFLGITNFLKQDRLLIQPWQGQAFYLPMD